MLLSLFALQSARSRSGHGRSCNPFLGGAAAQDCRGQVDRRQALHWSCRYRSNLIAAARLVENIDRRSHRQSGTEANPTRCVVSPQTRMMYIPANDNLCTELAGEPVKYVQGDRYMGVAKNVLKMVAGSDHIGELQASDLDTGKKVWTTN